MLAPLSQRGLTGGRPAKKKRFFLLQLKVFDTSSAQGLPPPSNHAPLRHVECRALGGWRARATPRATRHLAWRHGAIRMYPQRGRAPRIGAKKSLAGFRQAARAPDSGRPGAWGKQPAIFCAIVWRRAPLGGARENQGGRLGHVSCFFMFFHAFSCFFMFHAFSCFFMLFYVF